MGSAWEIHNVAYNIHLYHFELCPSLWIVKLDRYLNCEEVYQFQNCSVVLFIVEEVGVYLGMEVMAAFVSVLLAIG